MYINTLNSYLKNRFGKKIYKISLDAGMTCPNRDGTLSSKGCYYCSAGGSGDFAANAALSISDQLSEAKQRIQKKTDCKKFIAYSCISGGAYSVFYFIFEQFSPIWPDIQNRPFVAAIVGAIFVGVGIGICVRVGGATCGDDALAMSLSKITKKDIQWMYLISDLTVLGLSLTYIPMERMLYSLLTVILSGQIIGWVSKGNVIKQTE